MTTQQETTLEQKELEQINSNNKTETKSLEEILSKKGYDLTPYEIENLISNIMSIQNYNVKSSAVVFLNSILKNDVNIYEYMEENKYKLKTNGYEKSLQSLESLALQEKLALKNLVNLINKNQDYLSQFTLSEKISRFFYKILNNIKAIESLDERVHMSNFVEYIDNTKSNIEQHLKRSINLKEENYKLLSSNKNKVKFLFREIKSAITLAERTSEIVSKLNSEIKTLETQKNEYVSKIDFSNSSSDKSSKLEELSEVKKDNLESLKINDYDDVLDSEIDKRYEEIMNLEERSTNAIDNSHDLKLSYFETKQEIIKSQNLNFLYNDIIRGNRRSLNTFNNILIRASKGLSFTDAYNEASKMIEISASLGNYNKQREDECKLLQNEIFRIREETSSLSNDFTINEGPNILIRKLESTESLDALKKFVQEEEMKGGIYENRDKSSSSK